MGQTAHKFFFGVVDAYKSASNSELIKIFDTRMFDVAKKIDEFEHPNRDPDLDSMPFPLRRPDVVQITVGEKNKVEVLELKPISCETGYKNRRAEKQLNGYMNTMKLLFGDLQIEGGNVDGICNIAIPFPSAGENATITFIKDENIKGLYFYKIDDGN